MRPIATSKQILLHADYDEQGNQVGSPSVILLSGNQALNEGIEDHQDDLSAYIAQQTQRNRLPIRDIFSPDSPDSDDYLRQLFQERTGTLRPAFQPYGSQEAFMSGLAATLIGAVEAAYAMNDPFTGTETYTVIEDEKEVEYLLFCRRRSLIDEFGNLLPLEERDKLRNTQIRYTGPRVVPVIPIGEMLSNRGQVWTFTLGFTYGEQRNKLRQNETPNDDGTIGRNTWLGSFLVYQTACPMANWIAARKPHFSPEAVAKSGNPALAAVYSHRVQTRLASASPASLAAYYSGLIKTAPEVAAQTQKADQEATLDKAAPGSNKKRSRRTTSAA